MERVSNTNWVLFLLLILYFCSACSSNSSSSNSDIRQNSVANDNSAISPLSTTNVLEAIYLNIRTPEGFYSEPDPDPIVFVTKSHIKNIDIISPSMITATTPTYELCTNDFTQALNWSEISKTTSEDLVDNLDSFFYYEFKYSNINTSPNIVNIKRVYKCNIIDRSNINLNTLGSEFGIYNELPIDPYNFKSIIEYIWLFSIENNYGNAILHSSVIDDGDNIIHKMYKATLHTSANNSISCDIIKVYIVNNIVNKITGFITTSESEINTLMSRYINNTIEIC